MNLRTERVMTVKATNGRNHGIAGRKKAELSFYSVLDLLPYSASVPSHTSQQLYTFYREPSTFIQLALNSATAAPATW